MEMHVVAFIAIGGTLLFEGLIWAIFPGPTRQMYIGMLVNNAFCEALEREII